MAVYPKINAKDMTIVEQLARIVHKAYCKEYERQKGEPYWTDGDYDKLDEATKEFDRVTVRAVLDEIFPVRVEEGE